MDEGVATLRQYILSVNVAILGRAAIHGTVAAGHFGRLDVG